MTKLVIFDLDGTLVDAYDAIAESLNYALKLYGCRPVSTMTARRAIGMGDRNFMLRFFAPKLAEEALAVYRAHHARSLPRRARLEPGARALLVRLKRRGYRIAIASNRPEPFTGIIVRHLGIRRFFDVIICAKGPHDAKPKPDLLIAIMRRVKAAREETLYVGDMTIDVRAGRRAKVRTVAITGGSSTRAELAAARPDRIIRVLAELTAILA